MIFTFIKLWFWIGRNSVAILKRQSLLKISFVLFCSIILLAAEFLICYMAFSYVRDFPGVGSILIDRLMYLFYFALFVMLVFSNSIITYTTIYRSKDTDLLFTYPLASVSIFRYKFIETVFLSSWAFLVLLFPFMISFGIVNSASIFLYPSIFLFFIPFLIIASSLGVLLTSILVKFMPHKKLKSVLFLLFAAVLFLIYIALKKYRIEERNLTLEMFILNQILPNVRLSHNPLFPSYWMSQGILKISQGALKDAFFYFLALLSTALFFLEILTRVEERVYLVTWLQIRSIVREKLYVMGRGIIETLRPFLRIFGSSACGLITKDMKLFWRDPSQWSQFVIFFGLLTVYFTNIRNFSYNMLEEFWRNICSFLNLLATLLTLGSLSTRFIFPQISLEGNKFWIIGLAPVSLRRLLYQKFWMNVVVCLFITETLIIISNRMLGVSDIMMYSSAWAVFIMNFALVGLSVGLGASFPDFRSDNTARIVSGFGGTLTLILSISFIVITGLLFLLPFQLFLKGAVSTYIELKRTVFYSMAMVTFLGLGLCIVPLLCGERHLKLADY